MPNTGVNTGVSTGTRSQRREFLQLAKTYDPNSKRPPNISGWAVSEKLDGTRCFWDGGITRGIATTLVPWASVIDPKTGGRKNKIKPVATGLWSRYGNPIMAPDEFLNLLPCCPLDGELWAGRGNFQLCRSICGGDTPDSRFMDNIEYAVYSSPCLRDVLADGQIKNTNFHLTMDASSMLKWAQAHANEDWHDMSGKTFQDELKFIQTALDNGPESKCYLHQQKILPKEGAAECVNTFLDEVLNLGGEGVIIRNLQAQWTPKRVGDLLKYKPFEDDEGKVIGFTSGRETDKGSKLLGMIGSLILDYKGKRLELAGLTNEERRFESLKMAQYAQDNPGQEMPANFQGKHFKVGDIVTFKYRELSDDGIPKEARYWRRPMPERNV